MASRSACQLPAVQADRSPRLCYPGAMKLEDPELIALAGEVKRVQRRNQFATLVAVVVVMVLMIPGVVVLMIGARGALHMFMGVGVLALAVGEFVRRKLRYDPRKHDPLA